MRHSQVPSWVFGSSLCVQSGPHLNGKSSSAQPPLSPDATDGHGVASLPPHLLISPDSGQKGGWPVKLGSGFVSGFCIGGHRGNWM